MAGTYRKSSIVVCLTHHLRSPSAVKLEMGRVKFWVNVFP